MGAPQPPCGPRSSLSARMERVSFAQRLKAHFSAYKTRPSFGDEPRWALKARDECVQKAGCVSAVDPLMIEAQREIRERAHLKLTASHDSLRPGAVDAEDAELWRIQHGCPKEPAEFAK